MKKKNVYFVPEKNAVELDIAAAEREVSDTRKKLYFAISLVMTELGRMLNSGKRKLMKG